MKLHAERGHRPGSLPPRPRLVDDEAITPVIGSILILGISVLGISAIMVWGAPALQILQEQNAHAAMLGEFHDVRQNSLVLTITDSSRLPGINLNSGELSVERGTRMAITTVFDTVPVGCTWDIPDWDAGENADRITISLGAACAQAAKPVKNAGADNCAGGDTCLRFYSVDGRLLTDLDPIGAAKLQPGQTKDYTLASDIDVGSFLIRYESEDFSTLYAETWIIEQQALHWSDTGRTEPLVRVEGGSLFSGRQGNIFIEQGPPVAEQAFGSDELALRLPIMEGPSTTRVGGQSIILFMRLDDNILRVNDEVRSVQYDFEGRFARAWCTALTLRGEGLSDGFAYRPLDLAPDRACTGPGSADGRHTVLFDRDAGTNTFPFAFTHVQISIET